jgi:DNA-binding CsgD family transcriptional regulator
MSPEWVESALRIGPSLARAAKRAGDEELVRTVTAAMEEMAAHAAVPYAEGGALVCRALADSDPDIALAAVEVYRPSDRAPEVAAACEDAGGLLAVKGQAASARDLFEQALAAYEQLGAVRDSARALASMRELGIGRKRRGARKRPSTGWDALTPSELEVVRLATEGLTNPQIGQRLFISRRTVQTHLAHAFRKLDISSRVGLAAAAKRGGV